MMPPMYSVLIYKKNALCKSRKQRRSLTRIEQPAHGIARVDAIDAGGQQLAHGELAHLARRLLHVGRQRQRVGSVHGVEEG